MISISIDKKLTGKTLKEIRQSKNITIETLSQLTKISQNTIKCYEYGYRIPTLKNAVSIANSLNVSIDSFIMYKALSK